MNLLHAIVTSAAVSQPLASFAKKNSNVPLTGVEVRVQLIQLEKAGDNPARRDDASYPSRFQAGRFFAISGVRDSGTAVRASAMIAV